MKKIVFIAAMFALVSACSKDDSIIDLPTTPTEKPDTGTEGKDPATTPPTTEDLKAYFKITTDQTAAQATQFIATTTGKQTVNGKVIDVTKSNVLNRNDEEGKLIVMIEGTISGKAFSKEYSFEELVKKPGNYHMASRAQIKWKNQFEKAPEATTIAFDELYRLKQTDKFTAQYLSQWVEFYSSTPDGNSIYTYTDEDIEKTQLSEVKYSDGKISFILTYNGTKGNDSSKDRPALRFDKNEFYKRKITLNTENIKQYYMQGVYENLESFYGNAIRIENAETFVAELVPNSKHFDRNSNTISCHLSLSTYKNSNDELARFEYKFEGFKPLSDLKEEWLLATTSDLNEYMKKRLSNTPDGNVLTEINKIPVAYWIKMAQVAVRRNDSLLKLYVGKGEQNNIEVEAWMPESRRVIHSDILLLAPHFEVVSARKNGNRLYLQVALTNVNEVSLSDVVAPLEVMLF
ncbi:MAG: hypothetical protein GY706_01775 [Bacteroides sp.]|nr:hypothetical protein [Bacteroides sp.]